MSAQPIDTPDADSRVAAELAGRLNEAVGDRSKADIARRAEISSRTLTRYLSGEPLKLRTLIALADACGVSVEWLATGRGDRNGQWITARTPGAYPIGAQPDGSNVSRGAALALLDTGPKYIPIPRFDVAASAGAGAMTNEHPQVVEYFSYAEDFLRMRLRRRAEELGLVEARGDSMQPTINDGDILTVDIRPNQPLENGLLYVIANGDALVVKRVELRFNSIVLHSDNTRYSPETFDRTAAEQLHVVGQVLLVSSPPK